MNTIRNMIAFIFLILMIIIFFYIDYEDLSWHTNRGNYVGILTGMLGIVSMIGSNIVDKKRQSDK